VALGSGFLACHDLQQLVGIEASKREIEVGLLQLGQFQT
jgi:hypothetical protein